MDCSGISNSILKLTPTVARLFDVPPPDLSEKIPLESISTYANRILGSAFIERCLIFCPDALGVHFWEKYPDFITTITKHAEVRVNLLSVFPPKTPVCFASIFTGALPEEHGIRQYERPVLTCDTLFDSIIRSNRKVAIIAVRNSSIDLIFRNRDIDYYSEAYDPEVTERAIQVIEKNAHHLIVVYQQEYDDLLHSTEPFSSSCFKAASNHVESFDKIAESASKAWINYNYAIIFAPDHGAHFDPETGRGDHGLDIPEDMLLSHWYGLFSSQL